MKKRGIRIFFNRQGGGKGGGIIGHWNGLEDQKREGSYILWIRSILVVYVGVRCYRALARRVLGRLKKTRRRCR